MRFKPVIVAAALLAAIPSYSQDKALKVITREESEKHMRYLSSDNLEGRRTGSEGNRAAADYISNTALKIGVKPLPGQSDLFQPLKYLRITPVPGESRVTLKDTTGNVLHSAEVMPLMPPGDTVSLSGDIVFGGYGYMNSEEKYNDFAGISVNDRVVIIMTRVPELRGSGMPLREEGISEMTEARKLPTIMLQKARAVLFVADPALGTDISADLLSMGTSYQLIPLFRKQMFSFSLNAYAISVETADMLLGRSGVTLKQMQDSIASSRKPASFIIPAVKAEIRVNVVKDTVTSSNIVGYIEGSDPVLKDEAVIYTAHYDHVGRDVAGNIYNGANDNASGTVGLLNIASAFAALDKKPARSVIFFWTTGEEEGLHGSTHYAENPIYPLEKTVANLNFDMIGRSRRDNDTGASPAGQYDITGRDTIKVISGADCRELVSLAADACMKSDLYMIDEGKGMHFSGSDHYPFFRKGIPVLFFFTGLHTDYHKPSDDFEFIDFDKLLKVSRAGFLTGYDVAASPARLEKDEKPKQ
ncbi:M20/M25/M40 family metallo-hydrolase [bacterium]|nr:M20/M25/M40 family metallo-hydrolase [bacterium]